MNFSLESPAFKHNALIPLEYTCEGDNHPPPLIWHNPPPHTQSFVLIMDDPDAPMGVWVHWVLLNLPADYRQLRTGATLPASVITGKNSWGKSSYGGPCPPSGTHRYFFKLYALDTLLSLDKTATKQIVEKAMQQHILEHCELIGKYTKS
ncbi:Phosphatidylethanolamine-binding protein [Legionella gratiana]|uniref:Phosphatidylethanolamine-binding protein n=1 Tax=Legionella gratiana TaxID=45066 RepID=A0A378JKS1_9GAMM|nr:YbhB/YbcL family Raf kinase inhibitor-like protein [Legionella gratiana]KTD06489.1 Phosphatidylethanolamine-binding protein [Legionella gratiana]STX45310.1 Phosphatidylethanolamine-binding protein [Legionella gratiana]